MPLFFNTPEGSDQGDIAFMRDNLDFSGLGGNDLVLGDMSFFYGGPPPGGDSLGNATSIDGSGQWFTSENPLVFDDTVPWTSVVFTPNAGDLQRWVSFTAGAGETITIDIDAASGILGSDGSQDIVIELYDGLGNLVASNDDSSLTDGGFGSISGFDSFLQTVAASGGTYYINVRTFGAAPFDGDESFVMNLSVTNHAVSGPITQTDDVLSGGSGDDQLFGQGGDDRLVGGLGNDLLHGGSGVDRVDYSGASGGITVDLNITDYQAIGANQGSDRLVDIEDVRGSDFNDVIYGNGAANTLNGGAGNDTLYGDSGDVLFGGSGDDTLVSGGDGTYNCGIGNDLFIAGLTFSVEDADGGDGIDTIDLRTFDGYYEVNMTTGVTNYGENYINFENLISGNGQDIIVGTSGDNTISTNGGNDNVDAGAGWDTVNGGDGDDTLFGNDGNDTLYGDAGNDTMSGGFGDDTFYVTEAGDIVIENSGEGTDTVYSTVSYALSDNVEILRLVGGQLDGTGNAGNNTIFGTDVANVLAGNAGSDVLYAGAGSDQLYGGRGGDIMFGEGGADFMVGGKGKDFLYGGGGLDKMVGALGADTFVYLSTSDAGGSQTNSDIITDFDQLEGDRIDLSAIDADAFTIGNQAFTFIGTAAFSGTAGELRYFQGATRTIVEMDTNGDGNADAYLRLDGLINLTAGDFVLVNGAAFGEDLAFAPAAAASADMLMGADAANFC